MVSFEKRLGEAALVRIEQMSKESGIRVANVFHAGDGNLHPLIMFDGKQDGALEKAEALAAKLLRLCIEMGGSITGEHGVGVEKRDFLPQMFDATMAMMERLRQLMILDSLQTPERCFLARKHPPSNSMACILLKKQG